MHKPPQKKTRCSAIAETALQGSQKWKTRTGRQYFTDIIGLASTTAIYRPENLSNSVKKRKIMAITAFKVVQGHRGRYQSKALCDFLLVINSN